MQNHVKQTKNFKKIVFLWENFGPQHHDRLAAVALHVGERAKIIGVELSRYSRAYAWAHQMNEQIEHIVICNDAPHFFDRPYIHQIRLLFPYMFKQKHAAFALCHYEQPAIFLLALCLRLAGRRVIIMNDSKFDDYQRSILRELIKAIFYWPYHGALVASRRSADYLAFLGVPRRHIYFNYDNISVQRIRNLARTNQASAPVLFSERHFIIVARLVAKKNLFCALDAYALYRTRDPAPRRLVICGNGPLENELKTYADQLGILDCVEFKGFVLADIIAVELSRSLALILLSTEEQFGQVVLEAQALNIPVIVSNVVGANDFFVRNGTNGFIAEPDDVEGVAEFMAKLSNDQSLWTRLAQAAEGFSERGDAKYFASSLHDLLEGLS